MIIDDDASMLEMLRAVLADRGYEVVTEASPEFAGGSAPRTSASC